MGQLLEYCELLIFFVISGCSIYQLAGAALTLTEKNFKIIDFIWYFFTAVLLAEISYHLAYLIFKQSQ